MIESPYLTTVWIAAGVCVFVALISFAYVIPYRDAIRAQILASKLANELDLFALSEEEARNYTPLYFGGGCSVQIINLSTSGDERKSKAVVAEINGQVAFEPLFSKGVKETQKLRCARLRLERDGDEIKLVHT